MSFFPFKRMNNKNSHKKWTFNMFITKSLLLPKKFIIRRSLLQKARAKEKPKRNLQKARKKARAKEKNLRQI